MKGLKVDKELILKVAENARLELSEKEIDQFIKDFKEILEAFSKIDEVNTQGVRLSFQPVELKNMMREDKVEPCLTQEEALANTPHKRDGYFKGPRVI